MNVSPPLPATWRLPTLSRTFCVRPRLLLWLPPNGRVTVIAREPMGLQ